MESVFGFCLVFVVGCAGFFLAARGKVPTPALLGSMFATGILNLAGYYPSFPTWFISLAANFLIGMMIGRQIDRSILSRIRALARPVFIQTTLILARSIGCGYTLHFMGGGKIDLLTSFIGAAAGGIAEMAAFGLSMNADVSVVVLMQATRIIVSLSLVPFIAVICEKLGQGVKKGAMQARPKLQAFSRVQYAPLTFLGIAGSSLGVWLGIPSGGLLGAVVLCGAYAVVINKVYTFNLSLCSAAQIGLGLVLGQRITPEIVAQLWLMLLPTATTTLVMLLSCTLFGLLLHRTMGWDLTLCLLCSAPAGLSQITAYAEEIGVDSFIPTVFQTVRILSIVAIYPLIILPIALH